MPFEGIDSVEIQKGGRDYDPVPEDVYEVQISDIKKIEDRKYMSEEMETKLNFEFTITSGEYTGRKLFRRVRPSLAIEPKESLLYQLASAALGKKLTKEDFEEFHLSELENAKLKVSVTQTERNNGAVYNNIASFMRGKSNTAAPKQQAMKMKQEESQETVSLEDIPF